MSATPGEVPRLTSLARCAGCAAKLGLQNLSSALAGLSTRSDPRLLVGRETFDDAAIFVVSDDLALVQTLDFFAPIVDDPYLFGQIAAANALSDVYAMGGEPLTAMNIVGFPSDTLPLDVLTEILRGGQDKVHEAGALVVGGHSIIDEEPKFGLSVTGRVHPQRILSNANAQPGDRLLLTKSIGTGLLATLAQRGALGTMEADALYASMCKLNDVASRAALRVGARCATDITGFGLLGHLSHVAAASQVTIVVEPGRVPLLPGALASWGQGIRTGGAERNAGYLEPLVSWGSVPDPLRALMLDPQTSGGLVVAMPASKVAEYLSLVPEAVEIGRVLPRGDLGIVLA
jgi:selenide, water dikinase